MPTQGQIFGGGLWPNDPAFKHERHFIASVCGCDMPEPLDPSVFLYGDSCDPCLAQSNVANLEEGRARRVTGFGQQGVRGGEVR